MAIERTPRDPDEHLPSSTEPRASYASEGLDILAVGGFVKPQQDLRGWGQYSPVDDLRPVFFQGRDALRAIRLQLPEMEKALERLVSNHAGADGIRSAQHQIDLHTFQLHKLEREVPGLQARLRELGEDHSID